MKPTARGALLVLLVLAITSLPLAYGQSKGVKKRRPLPHEFGNVVMNNLSEKGGLSPVVFSHWVHRSRFTCRLCHVDIGFAMTANGTQMREADNRNGLYCGACHNGKMAFAATTRGAGGEEEKNCTRCHSAGLSVPRRYDFPSFAKDMPRERFGNGIDWESAELDGKIGLLDALPEISVKRKPLQVPKEFDIEAKVAGMPEIVFSHRKHAVWNGCELCHPDIYSVKSGSTKYSMEEIFDGRYCGACHGSVAFPTTDCQRCHVKSVTG